MGVDKITCLYKQEWIDRCTNIYKRSDLQSKFGHEDLLYMQCTGSPFEEDPADEFAVFLILWRGEGHRRIYLIRPYKSKGHEIFVFKANKEGNIESSPFLVVPALTAANAAFFPKLYAAGFFCEAHYGSIEGLGGRRLIGGFIQEHVQTVATDPRRYDPHGLRHLPLQVRGGFMLVIDYLKRDAFYDLDAKKSNFVASGDRGYLCTDLDTFVDIEAGKDPEQFNARWAHRGECSLFHSVPIVVALVCATRSHEHQSEWHIRTSNQKAFNAMSLLDPPMASLENERIMGRLCQHRELNAGLIHSAFGYKNMECTMMGATIIGAFYHYHPAILIELGLMENLFIQLNASQNPESEEALEEVHRIWHQAYWQTVALKHIQIHGHIFGEAASQLLKAMVANEFKAGTYPKETSYALSLLRATLASMGVNIIHGDTAQAVRTFDAAFIDSYSMDVALDLVRLKTLHIEYGDRALDVLERLKGENVICRFARNSTEFLGIQYKRLDPSCYIVEGIDLHRSLATGDYYRHYGDAKAGPNGTYLEGQSHRPPIYDANVVSDAYHRLYDILAT